MTPKSNAIAHTSLSNRVAHLRTGTQDAPVEHVPVPDVAAIHTAAPRRIRPAYRLLGWSLILALTACVAAALFELATAPNNPSYFPFDWHTGWIRTPYPTETTVCFRKNINVTGLIDAAYLVLAADNFYDLRVNGKKPNGFYKPGLSRTLVRDSSTYTALAYPRRSTLGIVYAIKRYLKPGRNVIAVLVQSDAGIPRLAGQGVVSAGGLREEVRSDASWRCSPLEEERCGISWDDPRFVDAGWQPAVATGESVAIPSDGDPSVLDRPLMGEVLGAPISQLTSGARFRQVVTCRGDVESGWLRVASLVPYDVTVNGQLVASTSTFNRMAVSALARRAGVDAFGRLLGRNAIYQYPRVRDQALIDTYRLPSCFRASRNLIEITVHNRETAELATPPIACLDGYLRLADGSAQGIRTGAGWQVCTDGVTWQTASITGNAESIRRAAKPRWRGMIAPVEVSRRVCIEFLIAALLFAAPAYLLPRRPGKRGAVARLSWAAACCLVALVIGISASALLVIFERSPQDAFFSSPRFAQGSLALMMAAWLASIACALRIGREGRRTVARASARGAPARPIGEILQRGVSHCGFAAALALLTTVAGVLYTRNLNGGDYLPDEYVSLLAARGILHRGFPVFEQTGIIYTRSSLYHYLLALFMALGDGGPAPASTRLLAGLWQLLLIPLVYVFGRELKGKAAGLAAAALVAFSPYLVFYAREARFYTQFTFFTTLSFYLLVRSLRCPERNGYRIGVTLSYCAAYLSQQLAIAIVPAILLVVLMNRQGRAWLRPVNLAFILAAVIVMAGDWYAYIRWCQTPLPYVDLESVLPLAVHIDVLDLVPFILLSGPERAQAVVGGLCAGGLFWFAARRFRSGGRRGADRNWRWASLLYALCGITMLFTTLIVARPTNRYLVHAVPLISLAAACAAAELGGVLACNVLRATHSRIAATWTRAAYALTVIALCCAAYRPVRVWNSTMRLNNRGITEAARFVNAHRRPGDRIMFFSPEVAMVELGKCDYMWRPRRGSIFKYLDHEGLMRERNSGAISVDNADKLRRVLAQDHRVWLVLHRATIGVDGDDPSGQMTRMLGDNFQVVHESLGMLVYLWDPAWVRYRDRAYNYGFDQFNF